MANIEKFVKFRNSIIEQLNNHEVQYKLVGGSIIQLLEESRETEDLDFVIKKSEENLRKFIQALVAGGYATLEELEKIVYEDSTATAEYNAFGLYSSNPEWQDFHIDLCFQLGKFSYDDLPPDCHTDPKDPKGIKIYSTTLRQIAVMKANVYPKPRPRDLSDIQIIADHLGLDTATGLPIENKRG